MSKITLKLIQEDKVYINFDADFDLSGREGYETTVSLYNKDGDGWTAHINIDDMPTQGTPEEAIDRMGLYLRTLAKAMKGKNIKHLNVSNLFKPVYKKR